MTVVDAGIIVCPGIPKFGFMTEVAGWFCTLNLVDGCIWEKALLVDGCIKPSRSERSDWGCAGAAELEFEVNESKISKLDCCGCVVEAVIGCWIDEDVVCWIFGVWKEEKSAKSSWLEAEKSIKIWKRFVAETL